MPHLSLFFQPDMHLPHRQQNNGCSYNGMRKNSLFLVFSQSESCFQTTRFNTVLLSSWERLLESSTSKHHTDTHLTERRSVFKRLRQLPRFLGACSYMECSDPSALELLSLGLVLFKSIGLYSVLGTTSKVKGLCCLPPYSPVCITVPPLSLSNTSKHTILVATTLTPYFYCLLCNHGDEIISDVTTL